MPNRTPRDQIASITELFDRPTFDSEAVADLNTVNEAARELARVIAMLTNISREQVIAIERVQEAVHWAAKAIARTQEDERD